MGRQVMLLIELYDGVGCVFVLVLICRPVSCQLSVVSTIEVSPIESDDDIQLLRKLSIRDR